jgi:hypothetical protein
MMKIKRVLLGMSLLILGGFYFTACEESSTTGTSIEKSLEIVPKVTPIEGAQNASIKVNKDNQNSYFTIDFSNIEPNGYIANGIREGWCIAYDKPIDSNGAIQEGLKISLAEDERWQPIRRLLGVKDKLLANNPDITYREIQVAIWALRDFPKFDLDKISVEEIPSRLVTDGNFNFDKQLVRDIVQAMRNNDYSLLKSKTNRQFNESYDDLSKEICVIETDSDTQTVIVPCDETFWAFGEINFRKDSSGQWGWVYISTLNEDNDFTSSTPLIAGAGKDDGTYTAEDLEDLWVGSLDVSLDDDKLLISYNATGGYQYAEAHLWVGCNYEEEESPAAPGQFPFKYEADELFTEYTFSLTIGDENDYENNQIQSCENNKYHIAAHGVVGGKSIE